MIQFCALPDDHPDLQHAPLLRAASLTLQYLQDHGPIPLTKNKAFKRVFVHWAAQHFNWPGFSAEELFRFNKVLNEHDFPPLEVLHFLLIEAKLARHYRGEFRITKRGAGLARAPGRLFAELIPFYIFNIDHSSYSAFADRPLGNWDTWLNVINVEADHGSTESALHASLYGGNADWDNGAWREMAAFSSYVLRPLEWAGLLVQQREETQQRRHTHHVFKTPLWRSALKLDTDHLLQPVNLQ